MAGSDKSKKRSLDLHPLVRIGISECIKRALQSKPTILHTEEDVQFEVYEIDGEIYAPLAAVEKLCGEYSWWDK